ncbi:MAG: hypothetical protein WCX82_00145 [archaeon]|jgi:hypothetical protein
MAKEKTNNKKLIIWAVVALVIGVVIGLALTNLVITGNATSTLVNKEKSTVQLTGVRITNPETNGTTVYYGTPIHFTATPIFSGLELAYPATTNTPRYLCTWTIVDRLPGGQRQILNPEPIINDCSITVTPGRNGVIISGELGIIVEAKTIVNGITNLKSDSRTFSILGNPEPLNSENIR